jgi:transcriptional regulator with XRE-family HTH domain
MSAVADAVPLGTLLKDWRRRRRLSQLDLALEAGVSARHLSFLETGRSKPSREMVLHLADQLEVPLRDRNALLLAAGHEPYPAVVVDRSWELIAANRAAGLLTDGIAPELMAPPANVLRASLHPDGLAPRIANLAEWREHLLGRLARQVALTRDPALQTLLEELRGYPAGGDPPPPAQHDVFVPLRLRTAGGELAFLGTIATFGTAVDVTVSELSIESFFPADEATARALRELA